MDGGRIGNGSSGGLGRVVFNCESTVLSGAEHEDEDDRC